MKTLAMKTGVGAGLSRGLGLGNLMLEQYNILSLLSPRFRGLHPGSILKLGPILSLWRNNLRLFRRLQLEYRVGNLLIDLDIRILRQAVIPRGLKQLLLH